MFKKFRDCCERFLRIPGDPEPPPGDEARTQRFRAAPNYYKYLLGVWLVKTAGLLIVLITMELAPDAEGIEHHVSKQTLAAFRKHLDGGGTSRPSR